MLRLNFRHTRDTIASHFICNEFVRRKMHFIANAMAFTVTSAGMPLWSLAQIVSIYFRCHPKPGCLHRDSRFFFSFQINFNLTQFRRSYFITPFRLIQRADAHSLLLRIHLMSSHLWQNINNKTFMIFHTNMCVSPKCLMKKVPKWNIAFSAALILWSNSGIQVDHTRRTHASDLICVLYRNLS